MLLAFAPNACTPAKPGNDRSAVTAASGPTGSTTGTAPSGGAAATPAVQRNQSNTPAATATTGSTGPGTAATATTGTATTEETAGTTPEPAALSPIDTTGLALTCEWRTVLADSIRIACSATGTIPAGATHSWSQEGITIENGADETTLVFVTARTALPWRVIAWNLTQSGLAPAAVSIELGAVLARLDTDSAFARCVPSPTESLRGTDSPIGHYGGDDTTVTYGVLGAREFTFIAIYKNQKLVMTDENGQVLTKDTPVYAPNQTALSIGGYSANDLYVAELRIYNRELSNDEKRF